MLADGLRRGLPSADADADADAARRIAQALPPPLADAAAAAAAAAVAGGNDAAFGGEGGEGGGGGGGGWAAPRMTRGQAQDLRVAISAELGAATILLTARRRGDAAAAAGQWESAEAAYGELLAAAEAMGKSGAGVAAGALRRRAAARLALGQPKRAWDDCTESLRRRPAGNAAALVLRARAARGLRRFQEAVADLDAAAQLAATPAQAAVGGAAGGGASGGMWARDEEAVTVEEVRKGARGGVLPHPSSPSLSLRFRSLPPILLPAQRELLRA